jgi:hypothetical protein
MCYNMRLKGAVLVFVEFYLIKWLGYELHHNFWDPQSILNPKVFKEYWDFVVLIDKQLSCHGGHESLPNILPKRKRRTRS